MIKDITPKLKIILNGLKLKCKYNCGENIELISYPLHLNKCNKNIKNIIRIDDIKDNGNVYEDKHLLPVNNTLENQATLMLETNLSNEKDINTINDMGDNGNNDKDNVVDKGDKNNMGEMHIKNEYKSISYGTYKIINNDNDHDDKIVKVDDGFVNEKDGISHINHKKYIINNCNNYNDESSNNKNCAEVEKIFNKIKHQNEVFISDIKHDLEFKLISFKEDFYVKLELYQKEYENKINKTKSEIYEYLNTKD